MLKKISYNIENYDIIKIKVVRSMGSLCTILKECFCKRRNKKTKREEKVY